MSARELTSPQSINTCALRRSWRGRANLASKFDSIEDAAASIIKRYQQGWAINTLSRELHLHRNTIKQLLEANSVPLRTRRYRNLQDARVGWDGSFSQPTPAALYWAGFLMADGSVVEDSDETRITCSLAMVDKDHVEALSEFVGGRRARLNRNRDQAPQVRWTVNSLRMANDLARWGIVSRKGRLDDVEPLGEARTSVDFWRGVVDGDGSIKVSARASCQVTLTGRRGITQAFLTFVEANVDLKRQARRRTAPEDGEPLPMYMHRIDDRGATRVILNGHNAAAVCELLYGGAPPGLYLDRKYEAAVKLIGQVHGRDRMHQVTRRRHSPDVH